MRRENNVWLAGLCALRLALELAVRAAHHGYTFLLSPTEIARVEAAAAWAKTPSLSPYGGAYWLPLQFVVEGALIRLHPDPFLAAFVVSAVAGVLTVAGVFVLALELGGLDAALAGALAVATSAVGLIFGVGGTADPLLHAGLVWALVFWSRFERAGRASDVWKGGLCLVLAGLARFEAWPAGVAAAAALLYKRGRRAWPAAAWACAAPLAWIAYCRSSTGDPLAFLHQTLSADILRPLPRTRLFADFLFDFLSLVPGWLIGLVALAAAGFAEAPAALWAAAFVLAACFILPAPWAMTQVDEHPWILAVLALPIGAAALAQALRPLSGRRRALAWGASAAAYLSSQSISWHDYDAYFASRQAPMLSAFSESRRLRAEGRIGPSDNILVEVPEDRRTGAFYEAWRLQDPPALFDRRLDYGPIGGRALVTRGNPSLLDDGAVLAGELRARKVRLVVACSREDRLRAAGLVPLSSAQALWTWADDGLVSRR